MFLIYWTIFQAYPVQCRSAWGSAMVSDTTYWNKDKVEGHAVKMENEQFFPLARADPHDLQARLTRPLHHKGITNTSSIPNATSQRMYDLLQKAKNKKQVGRKWMSPWTRGDTRQNFLLRAYCNMHRYDELIPHVYPLRNIGISPMQAPLKLACPYWSCILTEPRAGGKLAFLWIIAVPAALNLAHSRLVGECHKWWAWMWGSLLPLWSVMLIKSSQDIELVPFVMQEVNTVFDLRKWFTGKNKEKDNTHLATLILIILGGCAIYYYRDRIRHELGLHDWLPFVFAGTRHGRRHTFQVCVLRVDVKTQHEQQDDDSVAASGSFLSMKTLGIMRRDNYGYAALFGRTSLPERISVRLCYGNDEVQRTRVQQLGYCALSESYLFMENFTLSLEQRSGTTFKVDIRGTARTGEDFSSAVNFDSEKLEKAFQRSADALGKHRGDIRSSIADEQVVMMRNSRLTAESDHEMETWGFRHYPGSNGGQIWLAFCDLDEPEEQQACC
jgi:hypothetical protein